MTADIAARLEDLTARVGRIEAERGITETLYRYGHSIDYGDEAAWVDGFVEAGAFDLRPPVGGGEALAQAMPFGRPHALGVRIEGSEALSRFIARHTRAPDVYHKHYLIEPLITLAHDAMSATVQSYFLMVDLHQDERQVRAFGRYLDRLVRCDDGAWRFEERIAEIESMRS